MAGIYIHIPFCKQKCHYCNFYSVASVKHANELFEALIKEIELQKDYLSGEKVETIYLGGGTPSMLSGDQINYLFDQVDNFFTVDKKAEITLEANPDDLNLDKLYELINTPINRLSIGIQSFFDQDLKYLNRVHSADQALKAIEQTLEVGFENLSIDLIYGIPTLSEEQWMKNLDIFLSMKIPHLSAYALTVEPKTALDTLIRKKKMMPVEDKKAVDNFKTLINFAQNNGYEHYEISNFCKKGFYSKHNVSYWKGKKYLGIGPSAHSFNGDARSWNVSHLSNYINSVNQGSVPFSAEILTVDQKFNEYVMVSLRTMWGTDVKVIKNTFGQSYKTQFESEIKKYQISGDVEKHGDVYYLTDRGKLFADGISSDLFV